MKQIIYFYNVLYYFYYRFMIKVDSFFSILMRPFIKITFIIVNRIPKIRNRFITSEENNAEKAFMSRVQDFTYGFATPLYARTILGVPLFGFYWGIYHILIGFIYPDMLAGDAPIYIWVILGVLVFITDIIVEEKTKRDDGHIIKEFDKKRGLWRFVWSIIATLMIFLAPAFGIWTSSGGSAGQYILSLTKYEKKKDIKKQETKYITIENNDNSKVIYYK